MAHIWVRAEQRAFEQRVGLTPDGAQSLLKDGHRVTVENSEARAIEIDGYRAVGCEIASANAWMDAPKDAIIFGLKELNADGPDLQHRHIMFGHAFKGQADGPHLLARFKRGGGTLYDLEYLVVPSGRRIAAFGYWAGFSGAAVGVMTWIAQRCATDMQSIGVYTSKDTLVAELQQGLKQVAPEDVAAFSSLIIGALGRVGTGAADLFAALDLPSTKWDMAETAHGGPFPEILTHNLFVNCILAGPKVPVFVPESAVMSPRRLTVIADVSCDPNSSYNPIPIYDQSTTFADPIVRVGPSGSPLDVMAIDNLPSMLPVESSEDYAGQLLPYLNALDDMETGVWGRAAHTFQDHIAKL